MRSSELMILMPLKMHVFLLKKYSRGAITYIGRMDPVMDSHIFNPNPHDLAITIKACIKRPRILAERNEGSMWLEY